MFTRSVAKDCMARAVFEQPPVLDVILRNIQYENENENENENDTVLTQRDMVSLLLSWCSKPLQWWTSLMRVEDG